MNIAQAIVQNLLEDEAPVRSCIVCEKETGQRVPGASHGYCKRHAIEAQHGIIKAAQERGKPQFVEMGQRKLAELESRPESDFPPDLSQQRAAVAQ